MANGTGKMFSDAEQHCRKDPEEKRFYEIFFQMCQKYGVRWASAEEKERQFIEEITRVSYERERALRLGFPLSNVRPFLHLEIGLTHNLTHTAKKADGSSGADRMENLIFPDQKGPEIAEYQQFPGFQSVGKDEVTSSNLVNSSKISLKLVGLGRFFLF